MSFITESKKVYQQVKLQEKIKPYMLSYEKPGSREAMQFADADTLQDLQKQADDLRKKGYVIGKMGKYQPPTQLPKTYLKQDYIINEESDDHEVSMARGELESIADKALKLSSLLKSKSEAGNPIEAWVQSKITKAADMVNTVHDYMVYNPNVNEELLNEKPSRKQSVMFKKADGSTVHRYVSGYDDDEIEKNIKDIMSKEKLTVLKKQPPESVKETLEGMAEEKSKRKSDLEDRMYKLEYEKIANHDADKEDLQKRIDALKKQIQAIKEETELDEVKISDIHKMQQDGKSTDEIAKELKLNSALVKRILGEDREWSAQSNAKLVLESMSDTQIALLKKEFDPLKNRQISTARANQLSNILDKLDDGSLDKLKNALIPFVSALAAVKTTQRKLRGVKITNVKVPGLEGMAEEKIPQDYLDYLRTIVLKNVDFYEVPPSQIIKSWRDEKNKDRFKGKMIDYKEEMAEENPGDAVVNMAKRLGLDNYGYARYGKDNVVTHRQYGGTLQKLDKPFKLDKPLKKEEAELKSVPSLEEGAKRYKEMSNVGTAKYVVNFHDGIKKHNDGSDFFDMQIFKNKEEKNKFITDLEKKGYRPAKIGEEVQLKPVPSLEDSAKKHKVDIEVLKKQLEKGIKIEKEHTNDEKTAEKIALAHIDERPDYYIQIDKLEKKPVEKVSEAMFDVRLDVDGSVSEREAQTVSNMLKGKGIQAKVEPSERDRTAVTIDTSKSKAEVVKALGNIVDESKKFVKEVKEPTGELKDACWPGYTAVGFKMKNGKRVPNCVPKSEAYKGAKKIVEKAWKKLKEKK